MPSDIVQRLRNPYFTAAGQSEEEERAEAAAEIERLRKALDIHWNGAIAAARNEALEEAAQMADAKGEKADADLVSEHDYDERNRLSTYSLACTQLAAVIRDLKEQK